MYLITAIIIKPGTGPVLWTRYSTQKMTSEQCEKFFSKNKHNSGYYGLQVTVTNFSCQKVKQRKY